VLAYLCGPIEFAADGGKIWRRNLVPFLIEVLGHQVYNPAEDEKKSLTDEEAASFRQWKRTDLERFRAVVRKIIQFDLDLLEDKADYLICYLDERARQSAGTAAELTAAHRKGVPVYLVSAVPGEQMSGWMLACADHLFESMEELRQFLATRYARPLRDKP
jgi:hypothetical protein